SAAESLGSAPPARERDHGSPRHSGVSTKPVAADAAASGHTPGRGASPGRPRGRPRPLGPQLSKRLLPVCARALARQGGAGTVAARDPAAARFGFGERGDSPLSG